MNEKQAKYVRDYRERKKNQGLSELRNFYLAKDVKRRFKRSLDIILSVENGSELLVNRMEILAAEILEKSSGG